MSTQISLTGFELVRCPSELAFFSLAEQWRSQLAGIERMRLHPRGMVESAYAALLVVFDDGEHFTPYAGREAEELIAECYERSVPWLERLPWELAYSRLAGSRQDRPARELVGNLDHPTSHVRVKVMELAWLVRGTLVQADALMPLLKNVANTLTGVEMAWGLAGALFDSPEDFARAAAAFDAADFADQYEERLKVLRGESLTRWQAQYWRIESRCRRLSSETAMNLWLSAKAEPRT